MLCSDRQLTHHRQNVLSMWTYLFLITEAYVKDVMVQISFSGSFYKTVDLNECCLRGKEVSNPQFSSLLQGSSFIAFSLPPFFFISYPRLPFHLCAPLFYHYLLGPFSVPLTKSFLSSFLKISPSTSSSLLFPYLLPACSLPFLSLFL